MGNGNKRMKTIGKRLETIRKAFNQEVLFTIVCNDKDEAVILTATATVSDEEDIDVDDNIDSDGPARIPERNKILQRYVG